MASAKSLGTGLAEQDDGLAFAARCLRDVCRNAPRYGKVVVECIFFDGKIQRVETHVSESHLCG